MDTNLHKRGVIKRGTVRLEEARANVPARGAPCAAPPRVRLLQLDEHTQAIEFTCACGEVSLIEVQCEKKS